MKKWKRVGPYAEGIIYARDNERKLVIPNSPVVYFELDTKKVWWHQKTNKEKSID